MRLSSYTEPARLRAVWAALAALLGTIGIVLTADLHALIDALIVAVGLAVPLIQGEATRAAVYSPATHHEQLGRATAGLADGPP